MKKLIALLLAMAMVLSLAACGGSSEPAAEAPAAEAPAEEPAAEEIAPVQPAEQAQEPENALDIAYTANLRKVYENTLSRMANNEYYGSETENGVKMALEYLEPMPEILTEDQINHAMRLAMCRCNSPDQPTPEPTPAEAPVETEDEPETVPEYPKYYLESFFTGWKRVTKEQYENYLKHVRNGATAQTKEGIENILASITRVIRSAEEDTPENNPLYVAYNIPNQPEPTPAEPIPESAGDTPEEVPETAGFRPIINNFPKKSKWDVWNVHPDEYLSSCVVPLVRCDENCHVLDTVYLKVDTPEEVKTLMSAAAVGNRRCWPKYNKQYRRETVQRAADIIEKYYI